MSVFKREATWMAAFNLGFPIIIGLSSLYSLLEFRGPYDAYALLLMYIGWVFLVFSKWPFVFVACGYLFFEIGWTGFFFICNL